MKKIISLLIALSLFVPVSATVKTNSVPGTVLEESVVTIKGKKLNSSATAIIH